MASTMRYAEDAPLNGEDRLTRAFTVEHDLPPCRDRARGFDRTVSLSKLVETEIIPRLMVAHGDGAAPLTVPHRDAAIGADEIEAFVPLVMQVEADELLGHVEALLARGVAFDTLMVDLLAPAARVLGEFWEEDRADFVDVTMGLWRLQEVIHEIADRVPADCAPGHGARRALFAAMPGDQHSFGTVVIDELFRRDGWSTERIGDAETAELLKRVADDWYDLAGLTVSCDCHIPRLPSLIAALRNVSRNPQLRVMVGGRIFSADPALADRVGADGTARDARAAVRIARALVREQEGEIAAYH